MSISTTRASSWALARSGRHRKSSDGKSVPDRAELRTGCIALSSPAQAPPGVDSAPPRVLIIEDDADLVALARFHLEGAGYDVRVATDGQLGAEAIAGGDYDLVVLDIGLPAIDGLELCRRLRARPGYAPVIMLTARGAEVDRVVGLELGADDYLVKPVSQRELVARVRALFRRVEGLNRAADTTGADADEVLERGRVAVNLVRRRVEVEGTPIDLTATEFDLLAYFLRHPGRVFTRTELLDAVWGGAFGGYDHTVNSHINRLRTKLGCAREAIETVWGVGYRFAEEAQ